MHKTKPPKRWINTSTIYVYYGRTIRQYQLDMKNKKRKPLLRTNKILIALLLMLLAVIISTALFSCKPTDTITYIDGWRIHSNVPVDTNGVGR